MRIIMIAALILVSVFAVSAQQAMISDKKVLKVSTTCSIKGAKLVLLPYKAIRNYEPVACTYAQEALFIGHDCDGRFEILKELLAFEGDTSVCSQKVAKFGYCEGPAPQAIVYSTQVDALYLFTTLVVGMYSRYYCPYPVLVDTTTGREVNDDPKAMAEIFEIYRLWYDEHMKDRFYKDYNVPLRNCKYAWYGIRNDKKYMLRDSFKIGGLTRPVERGNLSFD